VQVMVGLSRLDIAYECKLIDEGGVNNGVHAHEGWSKWLAGTTEKLML
jgi:hypothetical protein